MHKTIIIFIIIAFVMKLHSQEVAQWRGPDRDGKYNETGLLKQWPESGPKLLWHYDELGDGHSSAAVTNDMVYTAGTSEKGKVLNCIKSFWGDEMENSIRK